MNLVANRGALVRCCARLLLLGGAVACAAYASPLGTIPLPPDPAPQVSGHHDQNLFWLSAAYGLGSFKDFGVRTEGFGAYATAGRLVVGVRERYLEGFTSVHHGREAGLLLGGFLDGDGRWWAAAGIAALKAERREAGTLTTGFHQVGVPMELVWSPRFPMVGLELRLEGDVNGRDPMVAAALGVRLGKLR